MNWERGDKYYLKSGHFNICRINLGSSSRVYELWNQHTRECMGSGKASNDVEAQSVIRHLKDVAEAM